jgi:hypothetical protein
MSGGGSFSRNCRPKAEAKNEDQSVDSRSFVSRLRGSDSASGHRIQQLQKEKWDSRSREIRVRSLLWDVLRFEKHQHGIELEIQCNYHCASIGDIDPLVPQDLMPETPWWYSQWVVDHLPKPKN